MELFHLMEKLPFRKKTRISWRSFYRSETLKKLPGFFAIGHNRYSTTGETSLRNIQPFFADLHMGGLSIAHNGNLTNALLLREALVKDGAIFRTTSDTETIVQLIAKSKRDKFLDKLIDALFQIQGGFSLILMTNKKLVGVRDPFGIRPLIIGKLKNSYIFASETCALDIVGATFVREVENGEIVIVENSKIRSYKPFQNKKRDHVYLNTYILLDQIVSSMENVLMNTEKISGPN